MIQELSLNEIEPVNGGCHLSGTFGAYAAGAGLATLATVEVPPVALACGFVAGTLALVAAGCDYMGW